MAQKAKSLQLRVLRDIPYLGDEAPGEPRLDAWLPQNGKKNMPACILIHGGGWTTGDKADGRERNMAAGLCAMGYPVFSVNYHMAEYEDGPYQGKRTTCAWPACVMDVMDAVSYVRKTAKQFDVDPERICAIGSSAGGHLALLLAAMGPEHPLQRMRRYPEVSCRICGAVSLYGVPDIVSWGGELLMPEPYERMERDWLLASPAALLEWKRPPSLPDQERQPILPDQGQQLIPPDQEQQLIPPDQVQQLIPPDQVQSSSPPDQGQPSSPPDQEQPPFPPGRELPPILLIHGDADETVSLAQSEQFYGQLRQKGCRGSLMVIKGGKHSFDFRVLNQSQRDELAGFLKTCFRREHTI